MNNPLNFTTQPELALGGLDQGVRKRMRGVDEFHSHAALATECDEGQEGANSNTGGGKNTGHFLMAGPGFQACQK